MNYLQYVNDSIKNVTMNSSPIVLFGQNIAAGSCLGGLTRGMISRGEQLVINTPNIENTQVGVGFGLMLNGVSSVFFMKQQDFLLLGIDHLVNTYNFVRIKNTNASFTIVTIVVDIGYQGIQSSLNNFNDFCSIARVPGYSITNKHDAEHIIENHLVKPGFRIIGVSQRLFDTDILHCDGNIIESESGNIFQYYDGEDVTIVCFNFSFPQGLKLHNQFKGKGVRSSLFSVNAATPVKWTPIIENAGRTRKLVVLDDTKSINRSCYHLTTTVHEKCDMDRVLILERKITDEDLCPNSEEFVVDYDTVIQDICSISE